MVVFITKIRKCLLYFSVFMSVILPCPAHAVKIAYKFKPGSTYKYEISTKRNSSFHAFALENVSAKEENEKITLKPIQFRDGVWIVDISSDDSYCRRFLKPDGSLVAFPGETRNELPFLCIFPDSDLEKGKIHRTTSTIDIGKQGFPSTWGMMIRDTASDGKIRIDISGMVQLPKARIIKRELSARGNIVFDSNIGCPTEGNWEVTYSLDYANKEIAVLRTLWKFEETLTRSFRLTEVTP